MPLIIGTPSTDANITQEGSLALGSSILNSNQILMSSTSSNIIVAANTNRRYLAVMNSSAYTVFLGSSSSVTVLTGFELTAGSAIDFNRLNEQFTGALWGITLNTSVTLSYLEV